MSYRILTTILAGLLLCAANSVLAEPGDELIGDWERTLGARKTREVWHDVADGSGRIVHAHQHRVERRGG